MKLKKLRLENDLTQEEVSKAIGITRFTYSNYETGKTQPDYETLIKLADYFGCSVDYLLGHKTNDLIYVQELSETQKEFIEKVKILDDDEINILRGVLIRIEQEKKNPWLKNI